MAVTTFEKILQDSYKNNQTSQRAVDWLWNGSITKLGNVDGNKLLKENPANLFNTMSSELVGRMVLYQYQAKTAEKLKYWDRFPLIFVTDMTKDGFFGLNVHYVDFLHRAKLFDALTSLQNNKKYDDSTKLKISYQILKGAARFKAFKPCFKRYLNSYVRSRFLYISPEEWKIAIFLPVARFQKARQSTVWNESNQAINSTNTKNHNQSLPKRSPNRKPDDTKKS